MVGECGFIVVLEMRQGTWVMNLNKCDGVFITLWLHWRYSLSTVALLLKHSNQSSPSPEGRPFYQEIISGWVFLNKLSTTTVLGFFHGPISWYMKAGNPQILCSVLLVFPITHHPEYNLYEQYRGQKYYGHLFARLSCCQKFTYCFFSCCGRRFWSLGLPRTKTKSVCKHTIQ